MTRRPVLQLRDRDRENTWVVGTSPALAKDDPFYSEQIQIWNGVGVKENETLHWHYPPIEEYYLVLKGTLKLQVGGQEESLGPAEMLKVGPNTLHRVLQADCTHYLTIRVPASSDETKADLSAACGTQVRVKSGSNVTILDIPSLRGAQKV